ncbi:tRNA threonylcarbamoyladenosine dehydratase [Puniceicoccales bacterium CK1056]|uniref:tRNA threonylcarbamoyladenosine dehydratase n=1 Tax=Oceanipulchritudo coccoides TaxID=2706888 RepID=A0A6B2M029_9BACT|nr:tRNA threonylcarbamoyladenosine dehydratase [Oceanipulchritudo coccoides]NDV61762.1 tRNA threonylcarbamoyladenosine dehydratase [Oceanipulchritudo coccoides]
MQQGESDAHAERFGGIARLYGADGLERFQKAHVAIVGIGGVGSWVAEGLARSGIGTITLMDLDDICVTNTNRQIHALEETIGQSKIHAMANRLRSINPEIIVHELHAFYSESSASAFFATQYSVIVDAIDSVRQKSHLIATAKQHKRPIVTVGGAGGRIDPTRIKADDLSRSEGDRLLMLVRKKLRTEYRFPRVGKGKFKVPCVYSDEPPRFPQPDGSVCENRNPENPGGINCDTGLGSATQITATMAFFATAEVLKMLESR